MKDLHWDQIELSDDLQPLLLRGLQARPLTPEERPRAAQLLDQEHPLGAERPVGRTLPQVAGP